MLCPQFNSRWGMRKREGAGAGGVAVGGAVGPSIDGDGGQAINQNA